METQFFVVHWQKGKQWDENKPIEEQAHIGEHLTFLKSMADEGITLISGLTKEDVGGIGVLQFKDQNTAKSHISKDPCIQNQVMSFEIIPFNPIDWSKEISKGVSFISKNLRITENN